MRSIIDKTAPDEANCEIDEDYRQHARTECSFEALRKFMTKFNTKNKQNTDQAKQRSGSTRRRDVHTLKDETSEETVGELRTHRQITAQHSGNASRHPKNYKLRRAIQLFHQWSNHQQAVHVDQYVNQVDMNKHRRDEAPPLIVWS